MVSFAVEGRNDETLRADAAKAGVALRPDELRRIAQTLRRNPTMVELQAFDAQWSEHCSYKSSRHHLKKLPTSGRMVVLGPAEDSGILHLGEHRGERYGIVVAHESHNHPSQVVPFEGAATGIGGIVRDVWLSESGPVWIERQQIRSTLAPGRASVSDRIVVRNTKAGKTATTLRLTAWDPQGVPAARQSRRVELGAGTDRCSMRKALTSACARSKSAIATCC